MAYPSDAALALMRRSRPRNRRRFHGSCRGGSRGVQVELVIRRGAPWDKLLNVAADLGAYLIVVGAQGRRGAGLFLGSVTTRLATTSTRCVLIVPASLALAR